MPGERERTFPTGLNKEKETKIKKEDSVGQIRQEELIERSGGLTTAVFIKRIRTGITSFFRGKRDDPSNDSQQPNDQEAVPLDIPRRQPLA